MRSASSCLCCSCLIVLSLAGTTKKTARDRQNQIELTSSHDFSATLKQVKDLKGAAPEGWKVLNKHEVKSCEELQLELTYETTVAYIPRLIQLPTIEGACVIMCGNSFLNDEKDNSSRKVGPGNTKKRLYTHTLGTDLYSCENYKYYTMDFSAPADEQMAKQSGTCYAADADDEQCAAAWSRVVLTDDSDACLNEEVEIKQEKAREDAAPIEQEKAREGAAPIEQEKAREGAAPEGWKVLNTHEVKSCEELQLELTYETTVAHIPRLIQLPTIEGACVIMCGNNFLNDEKDNSSRKVGPGNTKKRLYTHTLGTDLYSCENYEYYTMDFSAPADEQMAKQSGTCYAADADDVQCADWSPVKL